MNKKTTSQKPGLSRIDASRLNGYISKSDAQTTLRTIARGFNRIRSVTSDADFGRDCEAIALALEYEAEALDGRQPAVAMPTTEQLKAIADANPIHTADMAAQRLCALQRAVHEHLGWHFLEDCFCAQRKANTFEEGYRNDGVSIAFIEAAVRMAMDLQNKNKGNKG